MSALLLVLTLALSWPGLSQAQSVSQPAGETKVKEGGNVTLECSYDSGFPTLLWYRQDPQGSPQFILHEGSRPQDLGAKFRNRFAARINKTSRVFPLDITSVQLSDSATYYCVLRDTARALLFGRGTQLTVEPKNQATSPPSVFVVKSRAPKNDKVAAACLAKGFYPKEVTITMNPGTEVVYDSKEGVLSPDGKYSAVKVVKVGPEEAVKCTVTHDGKEVSAEDSPSAPAAPTHLPAASPGFCESSTSSSTAEEPDLEKVNMLSLTVLGLRVLMAKSIAFNVLMTAKLFI